MAITEADILRGLKIGVSRNPINDAVTVAISSWHNEYIEIARKAILASSLSQSGATAQSLKALPVKKIGETFVIQIEGDTALRFIDQGVNGLKQSWGSQYSFKFPEPSGSHVKAIMGWIPSAGFRPSGKIKTFKQLAFAIATATKQHGIKPKRFIEAAFGKQSQQDLARALGIALKQAVRIEFRAISNKYK